MTSRNPKPPGSSTGYSAAPSGGGVSPGGPVPMGHGAIRKSTGLLTGVLHSRRVPLRGPLTERTAACCLNRMLVLASDNKKQPIVIEIDSTGGPIVHALSIIRTMNGIACPVATFCRGAVQGAAIIIAAHGSKSHRVSAPGAEFTFGDIARESEATCWHSLIQILAHDTGREEQEIASWLAERGAFDAQRALQMGLVDVLGTKPIFPGFPDE